jgi:hypothetical protein
MSGRIILVKKNNYIHNKIRYDIAFDVCVAYTFIITLVTDAALSSMYVT